MSRAVPEWRGRTDDSRVPPRVKLRIYFRYRGRCQSCIRKLATGDVPQFDHIIALANGGTNSETNIQLLCSPCHKAKTKKDVGEKSDMYRVRLKHYGVKRKPKGRPMLGTKLSGWKKPFNAGWVKR